MQTPPEKPGSTKTMRGDALAGVSPAEDQPKRSPASVPTNRDGRRLAARRPGFMLIEAALATVIIGVAVVALVSVIGSASRANGDNRDLTRAIFLAQEIRELMTTLPATQPGGGGRFGAETGETLAAFNDQDDFNGQSFSPPINAQRQALTGSDWSLWRQTISVANLDPNYLAGHTPQTPGATDMYRVTVSIYKGTRLLHQTCWVTAAN